MSNLLYILKKRDTISEAREVAEQEFTAFSQQFPQLDTQVETAELHELYRHEGKVGYLIRVKVEIDPQTAYEIIQWAQEHVVCDVPIQWDCLNGPLSFLHNQSL